MFHLYTSSKLSRQKFEFSLKVKVMGSNPGYLLKSFLLYLCHDNRTSFFPGSCIELQVFDLFNHFAYE